MSSSSSAYELESGSDEEYCEFSRTSDPSVTDFSMDRGSSPDFGYGEPPGDFYETFYQSCSEAASPTANRPASSENRSAVGTEPMHVTLYQSCREASTPEKSGIIDGDYTECSYSSALAEEQDQTRRICDTPESDQSTFEFLTPGEGYQFTREEIDRLIAIDKELKDLGVSSKETGDDGTSSERYEDLTDEDLARTIRDIDRKLKELDTKTADIDSILLESDTVRPDEAVAEQTTKAKLDDENLQKVPGNSSVTDVQFSEESGDVGEVLRGDNVEEHGDVMHHSDQMHTELSNQASDSDAGQQRVYCGVHCPH